MKKSGAARIRKEGKERGKRRRGRKSDTRGLCAGDRREVDEVARAKIVVNVFIREI